MPLYSHFVVPNALEHSRVPGVFLGSRALQSWLLWVMGYSLAPIVITPLPNALTDMEHSHNAAQALTRVMVEQILGQLKVQFHCLDRSWVQSEQR
eukprot:g20659.t1